MVLAQKIFVGATKDADSSGKSPVLRECVRVLEFSIEPFPGLPDHTFKGQAASGIDGESRSTHEGLGKSTIRIEGQRIPVFSGIFTRVAADKEPFAGLALSLNNVQDVVVGLGSAASKPR